MSYDQVVALVGDPSQHTVHENIAGITGDIYEWQTGGTFTPGIATVQFQNGAVVIKAQFGLN